MEARDTLQLRISYLKHRLSELPRGFFGTYSNRPVVYITRDPHNPSISSTNKRRLFTDSKDGQLYKALVNEYLQTEAEYKRLLNIWKQTYKESPVIISYPLDPNLITGITSEQFINYDPNQNKYDNDKPIVYKGQQLRSKNELCAVKQVEQMGFEWKTEIKLPDNLYPDVIFHIPFLQKAIAMEVDGMMDRQEYFYKADFRQYKYYRAGFEEFKDVVFYRLSDARSFDLTAFTRIIELAIEINASCIVRNSI